MRRALSRNLVLIGFCAVLLAIVPLLFPSAAIDDAARAIDDGVPEVAVARLEKLAATLHGSDAANARQRLAEALIAARQPERALAILEEPLVANLPAAPFLRAQALADLKQFAAALRLYQDIAVHPGPHQGAAAFGVAEMLRGLGREEEAIRQYQNIRGDSRFGVAARLREAELLLEKGDGATAKRMLDQVQAKTIADKRQKRFLRARFELLNQRPEKTVELLDSMAKKPESESHETVIAVLFALADAHLRMNTPELGDDYLEDFIEKHPQDVDLPMVFAKLDEVYRSERRAPRSELEKWSHDSIQPRRGLAEWYLAQMDYRAGHREEALQRLKEIAHTPQPMLIPALLQYSELLLDSGKNTDALAVLTAAEKLRPGPGWEERIRFETGRASYAEGDFPKASAQFEQVAKSKPDFASPALFDAALGWLRASDERAAVDAKALAAGGDADAAAEITLESALAAARRHQKNAATLLEDFVHRFPGNGRVADGWLALAELAYHSAPPNLDLAKKNLTAARDAHPSETVTEHADYLAIWLADAEGSNSDRVIKAATEFLRLHPGSPLTGEVRLKLAETHFRRQDFANAQTQFELLAQENATSPLTEKALFLAGQSAMSTMTAQSNDRALELFAQVVKTNGDLRWAARNEQAAIERRLGKPQEAQLLYDEVLKGDARGAEKREALCGKADTFLEQANTDTAKLQQAVAVYDQLASESANQPHWRNQALFKKGVCLEKESNNDAALSTFYSVLEFDPEPGKNPEFFWFYKAGFNAARLLEEQQKWESAAAVYEKLVAAKGPRSDEAKGRLDQLRLEHFLWQ